MTAPASDGAGLTVELDGPAATERLGRALGALAVAGDLLVLAGPLGAGKTVLARGIGAGLDVIGPVLSPTFVLAREHRPRHSGGPWLIHVDAYRLPEGPAGALELDDLDLDLERAVTVVEWGQGRAEGLAPDHLLVELVRSGPVADDPTGGEPTRRRAVLRAGGPGWEQRLARWRDGGAAGSPVAPHGGAATG